MTVIKHKEQRVGIFIDTQNLYHTAKNLYHARVNFGAIMKEAVAGRSLIRAIAYVITTESGEEKGFFEALGKLGIETKTKNLQIFMGGAKKADWDVGLAVDAISLAPKLDTIIIASGDGDFCPLVEYLKINQGCQVEVISFGKSSSAKLKETADEFIDMCENPKKYIISSSGYFQNNYSAKGGHDNQGEDRETPQGHDSVNAPEARPLNQNLKPKGTRQRIVNKTNQKQSTRDLANEILDEFTGKGTSKK
jgi:uncharacterized LabA/DUF88 family protein